MRGILISLVLGAGVAGAQPSAEDPAAIGADPMGEEVAPAAEEAEASEEPGAPEARQPEAARDEAEASAEPGAPEAGQPEAAQQEAAPAPLRSVARPLVLPQVDVIGRAPEALAAIPGSATVITPEELESQLPLNANEALRTVPGVAVLEEDGMGLRPNIGIRGLNPTRSRTLLVLEDGVPVALAPYGEPELYYAPNIDRMERLEVVKGSGSILFGPQTIGGVLNYVTADPPERFRTTVDARTGTFGYYHGQVTVGDTAGKVGYLVSLDHKRYGGPRNLNLRMTDFMGKVRMELGQNSSAAVKVSIYDELSAATYLGLTTPQFLTDPNLNPAIHDRLPVRRYAISGTHNLALGDRAVLQTTVYANQTSRDWQRQDFDRTDTGADYERIIDGAGNDITDSAVRPDDGSALYFRNSTGNRNRFFTVAGVEPRLSLDWSAGEVESELIAGIRFHAEQVHERRIDGGHASSSTGTIRQDEFRGGLAGAAFLHNRFIIADRLRISPGLRVELLRSYREILRKRVAGVPTDLDPPVREDTTVAALIPGLGVSYVATDEVTVFAGVHRGFSPPRTKDAITSDGELLELDAEYAWNYELGSRMHLGRYLSAELAGFLLDFSQQIIPPSEAGGAVSGLPARLNSGATLHLGVEASATADVARWLRLGFELPVSLNYTFVRSRFGEGWSEELTGNRLPYAPEHLLSAQARWVHPLGISAHLAGHYVSSQFTDKANTVEPTVNGLVGRIDGRFLLDARLGWKVPGMGLTAYVAGKNLTDTRFIASRAPRGIKPGTPRQFLVGVSGEL